MNIAKDITMKIKSLQPQLNYNVAWNAMAESIIASKLEPVRDAMKALYRACNVNDHTVITLDIAESVLALFKDDS